MAQGRFTFPKDFLWGTATAAHQVEGGNTNNNWYAWELGGKVVPGHSASRACEWWAGRWQEDFDRAAESGQNAHRFSVEWSRVQPGEGSWDSEALDVYRQMAAGLRERDMEPMVTLHHFTDPLWVYEYGAWERDWTESFVRYVERVVAALGDHVRLWCTFNEPNVYATLGYVLGDFPPGRQNLVAAGKVMANILRAHAAAYRAIHRIQPEARVGMAIHYQSLQPARKWLPLDSWAAGLQSRAFNDAFPAALASGKLRLPIGSVRIPDARGTQDFFGLNYYTESVVRFSPFVPGQLFGRRSFREGAPLSENGYIAHEPDGFYRALQWAGRFDLPIFITENGVEDSADSLRPRYLVEHIRQMWRAVNFNWKVQGYFHWSLIDNFEWERGWTQRFGLWELDDQTQERRKRPSADLYAEICRANALASDMVARYTPKVFPSMFPNE